MTKKWNVDIHFDYAMSVMVEADSIDDAVKIVEERIEKGEISSRDAEPTGDYETDTSWQPSD